MYGAGNNKLQQLEGHHNTITNTWNDEGPAQDDCILN